ncbi:hypothetical protein [Candidatus Ichthyocystis sparus]|uniref:hypothetical protein n=1 Tax=Candidatus Ichthyocystis sparus TaxID=1561004 RepID=UPI000A8857A0|nr:hypothetical protein [Candidatus Ichthyocystis sparus]
MNAVKISGCCTCCDDNEKIEIGAPRLFLVNGEVYDREETLSRECQGIILPRYLTRDHYLEIIKNSPVQTSCTADEENSDNFDSDSFDSDSFDSDSFSGSDKESTYATIEDHRLNGRGKNVSNVNYIQDTDQEELEKAEPLGNNFFSCKEVSAAGNYYLIGSHCDNTQLESDQWDDPLPELNLSSICSHKQQHQTLTQTPKFVSKSKTPPPLPKRSSSTVISSGSESRAPVPPRRVTLASHCNDEQLQQMSTLTPECISRPKNPPPIPKRSSSTVISSESESKAPVPPRKVTLASHCNDEQQHQMSTLTPECIYRPKNPPPLPKRSSSTVISSEPETKALVPPRKVTLASHCNDEQQHQMSTLTPECIYRPKTPPPLPKRSSSTVISSGSESKAPVPPRKVTLASHCNDEQQQQTLTQTPECISRPKTPPPLPKRSSSTVISSGSESKAPVPPRRVTLASHCNDEQLQQTLTQTPECISRPKAPPPIPKRSSSTVISSGSQTKASETKALMPPRKVTLNSYCGSEQQHEMYAQTSGCISKSKTPPPPPKRSSSTTLSGPGAKAPVPPRKIPLTAHRSDEQQYQMSPQSLGDKSNNDFKPTMMPKILSSLPGSGCNLPPPVPPKPKPVM